MSKMFFIPVLLFLMANTINATFPELPDMTSILEMVPINGQLRFNDQIFTFGSTTPSSDISTEELRVDTPQTPNTLQTSNTPQISNTLPQTPDARPQTTDNLPQLLNVDNTQLRNNVPINGNNFNARAQNEFPQPIADSFPPSFPLRENPPNFEPRIPSLESLLSTMRSQNTFTNSLPNIGSTELGSTFARNANSDFRDEFSQPSASTPVPFGFPATGASNEVRSNLAATESPLVVMPLVVSPDRLMQRNSESSGNSNPIPIPALFASSNHNERMSASERVESLPVSFESLFGERTSNGSADDSTQVVSRQSSIVVPQSVFSQLTNGSFSEERNFDAALDRHVMKIIGNSNVTQRFGSGDSTPTSTPVPTTTGLPPLDLDLFKIKEMPTLAQLEASEKQRSQSMPKTLTIN